MTKESKMNRYPEPNRELRVLPSPLCPDGHIITKIGLAAAAQVVGGEYGRYEQPMPNTHDLNTLAMRGILAARGCADPSGHLCEQGATSGL